ncbi:MAG: hypothetical protein HW382_41 [Deltaproteobacteria bacterium]|nr:hypothetical protein [Deltaproteobacteria bacterium]
MRPTILNSWDVIGRDWEDKTGEGLPRANERVVDIVLREMPELLTDEYFHSGLMGCSK